MSQLTRNPTLLTAVLSVATLAGYVSYRLTLGNGDRADPAIPTAAPAMDEAHDHSAVAAPLADALPAIVLNDLDGTRTALADFAAKPLLINFWATWCAPCLREIPLLKAFHEANEAIDVIGIAVDDPEPVLEYASQMQFSYPVLVGETNIEGFEAMAAFPNAAQVMPFSTFTAPGGAFLGIHYGELHQEHLDYFTSTLELLEAGTIDLAGARERMAEL